MYIIENIATNKVIEALEYLLPALPLGLLILFRKQVKALFYKLYDKYLESYFFANGKNFIIIIAIVGSAILMLLNFLWNPEEFFYNILNEISPFLSKHLIIRTILGFILQYILSFLLEAVVCFVGNKIMMKKHIDESIYR